jgi:adenosylcobinamide kinase/adenosylcobinamide-phosphate guanylyltransferase
MFAANLMGTHGNNNSAIVAAIEKLCGALRQSDRSVLLISNEVGSGIIPAYASGRQFRDLLGGLNQRVAEIADNVVLMIAGLPLAIKGSLEVLR